MALTAAVQAATLPASAVQEITLDFLAVVLLVQRALVVAAALARQVLTDQVRQAAQAAPEQLARCALVLLLLMAAVAVAVQTMALLLAVLVALVAVVLAAAQVRA
jgi:hypothetical protein